jgi:hypothetical protein
MAVFWVVAPCSLVEVYSSVVTLMMEAAGTSEVSVNFHQTAWRNNPEDIHIHTHHCENLKSHNHISKSLFGCNFTVVAFQVPM